MHFSLPTLTLALLATLTTALPNRLILPDTVHPHTFHPPANYRPGHGPIPHHIVPPLSTRDDRSAAATIFKFENLRGLSTFIPANDYCTDMTNIFGGFDGEVRSLSTEKGVKCDFYQEPGCNVNDFTGGGMVLEVGFRGRRDVRRRLGSWAGKIASVRCQRI